MEETSTVSKKRVQQVLSIIPHSRKLADGYLSRTYFPESPTSVPMPVQKSQPLMAG